MTGDREVQATRGFNDTQLMLARDAGDERGGGAPITYRARIWRPEFTT